MTIKDHTTAKKLDDTKQSGVEPNVGDADGPSTTVKTHRKGRLGCGTDSDRGKFTHLFRKYVAVLHCIIPHKNEDLSEASSGHYSKSQYSIFLSELLASTRHKWRIILNFLYFDPQVSMLLTSLLLLSWQMFHLQIISSITFAITNWLDR